MVKVKVATSAEIHVRVLRPLQAYAYAVGVVVMHGPVRVLRPLHHGEGSSYTR